MIKKHRRKSAEREVDPEVTDERPVEAADLEVMDIEPVESEIVDVQPVEPAAPVSAHRKHLALWLAVGGTMALIIVMWLFLLPMQLGEVRLPNAKDLSRWNVVTTAKEQSRTFEENLRIIHERLKALSNSGSAAVPAPAQPVNMNIDLLRQKLEAASLRNQQPPTNEAKK